MKIYIVVVTYNGLKWHDRCFGSLQQSEIPLKVIAVDNASTDGSCEYIRSHFPATVAFPQDKNLGFGQANNLGIRYAINHGADYVFLLNQDAWIEPDTIKNLVEIHQKHPEYGILSPIHLTADKQHIEPLLLHRLSDYHTTDPALLNDLYFGTPKELYDTQYVNAAAWLLPRKTLETVGGFDPIFFHYGEDDNYINRVLYHGMKIGICPKERIVHDMRLDRPLYDTREHEVLMMIEYTNVNKQHNIKKDMRQHWFKAITSSIKGRKDVAKRHYADYLWLKRNRDAIERSNASNKQPGLTWL